MVLLLHEMESLREFVIGSIRSTDKFNHLISELPKELPEGAKKPLQKALDILVSKGIISEQESIDVQEINEIRNTVSHSIHRLVIDVSDPTSHFISNKQYDYGTIERLELYKEKIAKGLQDSHIMLLSLRAVHFEQAAETYKEELARLKSKINRQYKIRYGENALTSACWRPSDR